MSNWVDFQYSAADGLLLAGRKYGWQHQDRLPVVCLPGLSRNSADFHELATYLSNNSTAPRRVLALDYRGRGNSAYDKNWQNYNIITEAQDVLQGIMAAGLQHVGIVGTSRGGLITMVLAAMRPGIMQAIVMNDIGPEINGPGLVRIKNMIENAKDPISWEEAAAGLKQIGSHHFPKWNDADWMRQARYIYVEKKDKKGVSKLSRNYDRQLIKTVSSINLDERLPDMWAQYLGLRNIPLLVVRGAKSDILTQETAAEMIARHPLAKLHIVADQGHAPDLGFTGLPEAIAAFFDKNDH